MGLSEVAQGQAHCERVFVNMRLYYAHPVRRMAMILVLMIPLALPSTSDSMLYGGTTQVLLASEYAVVIASDRAQHASNAGRDPHEQQKVERVGRVIVGISGTVAVIGADGKRVDLQETVPPLLRRYEWAEPQRDIENLTHALADILPALENWVIPGSPDPELTPQVTILLAGVSDLMGTFAAQIRYPGRYVATGNGYRLALDKPLVDYYDIKPGKVIVSIQTRREDVERRAKDLIAGRASDEKYPLLARFLANPPNEMNETLLKAAAAELVRVTMDLDDHIGGGIDVISLKHRP